ncbi:acid phosphatase-related [Holotrichia oblita]|uniref:Acid phosphatase-related n=1 Tax=Holotrichia oblita TaxID=644536 RepID=A0ACB9SHN5_HOLOL|nr:acid phosphatase-related [Holotrichia oblita]
MINFFLNYIFKVFRHGDRVIINPYPNDPYRNNSYWPAGWGQLTNLGKLQEYNLGKWLRKRYDNFLPSNYSEKDIFIRSTDVDRTLMSAEANLAGLYPPQPAQTWDSKIPWQPIPVHTIPVKEDYLVAMQKSCPKYDALLDNLLKSKEFVELNYKFRNVMNYVSRHSGAIIDSFEKLEYIYNTLFIESINNFTLPNWTKTVFPDQLRPAASLSFAIACYTRDLARLKTGPFFNELIQNINNVTDGLQKKEHYRKMWLYSGHDTTIANVLQSLNLFEYHNPPYSSTILFELRSKSPEGLFVNIYYKNSTQPQAMTLNGCNFDCPIDKFINLLSPIALTHEEWKKECKWSFISMIETADKDQVLVLSGVILISLVIFVILMKIIYTKYNEKPEAVYLRLPDDDEQV